MLAAACSDDAGRNSGHDESAERDDASGPVGTDLDPCSAAALRKPRASTVYYVAIDEPGADDQACDGLAPSDQGDGHCPFRDFDSDRTRSLLDGVADTRVELHAARRRCTAGTACASPAPAAATPNAWC